MKGHESYDWVMLRALYRSAKRFWPWRFANRMNLAPIIWFALGLQFGETASIERCLEKMGLKFEGKRHDALDDARNEARLMAVAESHLDILPFGKKYEVI